ncbi:MAG: hypothetical protein HQL72_05770 [Magnetococcales bacterium]|nr:hypothetical protein [Magnetococcales bacterium]
MNSQKDDLYQGFFNNILEHTVDRASRTIPDFFYGSGSAGCVEEQQVTESQRTPHPAVD